MVVIRNQGKLDWFPLPAEDFGIDRVFSNMAGGVRQYINDLAIAIQVGIGNRLGIAANVKNAENIMLILG